MEAQHMGTLLEHVVRKKGINITELAKSLKVSRRTIYSWFKQEQLNQNILHRISDIISENIFEINEELKADIQQSADEGFEHNTARNDDYWKDKYLDLLERYSDLLIQGTDSIEPLIKEK
jgi:predicted transcriptional regulator